MIQNCLLNNFLRLINNLTEIINLSPIFYDDDDDDKWNRIMFDKINPCPN